MIEPGSAADLVGRAVGDDLAAVLAGAGADVDEVVGGAHHRLVVLDDEHGVAEVAQARERADQALVVALGAGRPTARRRRTARP